MNEKNIHWLLEQGFFSEIDIHFAKLMTGLSGQEVSEMFLAAALVSHATSEGHICLNLSDFAGKPLSVGEMTLDSFFCPKLSGWLDTLKVSSVIGKPGEFKPLILDDCSRLYLYRYWDYENSLANALRARASAESKDIDLPLLKDGLTRLFPQTQEGPIDRQELAALVCVLKRFCVISGGPGTGKTSLTAKIIALILEQYKGREMRIFLAAPTGKAAARLQEAIRKSKETLPAEDHFKKGIPVEASTIHRLLGAIPNSPYFRHDSENPLPTDMVVVDEASMVDLALMSKLLQAIPSDGRVILLGDQNQLASVEAGAMLGDICDTGTAHGFSERFANRTCEITGNSVDTLPANGGRPGIQDCIVELQKSFRFGPNSGINAVGRAVNEGDGDLAIRLLKSGTYEDIRWKALPEATALPEKLRKTVIRGYKPYLEAGDPVEAFNLLEQFRLLCALRQGPYGVVALNHLVEKLLREEKLINPDSPWYQGRPVMITKNDYNLGLFNGDIGIILPDPPTSHHLRAFFLSTEGALRTFSPIRLPEHESVYAMTVHKSQGSEFDSVLLLLPDRPSPVLTRELFYTGITRARREVEIWGRKGVFLEGVSRRIERSSGLRDALWGC